MAKVKTPRWTWALTGPGHFFKESLHMLRELDDFEIFVGKAASEVVRMYRKKFKLPPDTMASAAPVVPKGMVKLCREINLNNSERLKSFDSTAVEWLANLRTALDRRRRELHG